MDVFDMEYYAKSMNKSGRWITVKEHLLDVSRHAAEYGSALGLGRDAELTGLMHDIGKYSGAFQAVLAGEATKVDHAFPGACICRRLGARIAETIAGHHCGLMSKDMLRPYFEDYGSSAMLPSGRSSALRTKEELTAALGELYKDFGKDYVNTLIRDVAADAAKSVQHDGLYGMLDSMAETRMLFSCLVDADYSSSAYEDDSDMSAFDENVLDDPDGCLARLEAMRAEAAGKPCTDAARRLRDTVYESCGKAGADTDNKFLSLTAPTGSGKTFGFFNFALGRLKADRSMKRIVIALPFLSLTDQVADIAREIIPGAIVDTSTAERGDDQRDISERWSAPCVITTTVQLFQSLFSDKPGDCRKLHRLGEAVIILDEVQALPDSLAAVCVHTLKSLSDRYGSTVCLSTATPPAYGRIAGLRYGAAEITRDAPELFAMAPAEKISELSLLLPLGGA